MKNVVLVLMLIPLGSTQAAVNCEALFERHLESDMVLTYEEFDQTMGSGFRVLAGEGCEKEAADLIEAYIRENSAEQNSLRWHIAQLRAMHGDNNEAVLYAKTTLIENEDFSVRALRWNDYVLATIAFLENDEEALNYHRDKVAEGIEEHPGNEMNLRLLDALARNLGSDYATALKSLQ